MMTQIRIHDDNEVSIGMFDPMLISCAQPKFGSSRSQQNPFFTIKLLQLFCHLECSIWATIIDNNYLVIEFTAIDKKKKKCIKCIKLNYVAFRRLSITYLSLMYFTSNQIIIGKFSRSLYVGNKMEYLSAGAIFPEQKKNLEKLFKVSLSWNVIQEWRNKKSTKLLLLLLLVRMQY